MSTQECTLKIEKKENEEEKNSTPGGKSKKDKKKEEPSIPANRAYSAYLSVVWFLAFMGQFLLIGKIAHRMGDPVVVPGALRGFNKLFNYGPESAVEIFFLVLWLAFIAGSSFLVFKAIFAVTSFIHNAMGSRWSSVKTDAFASSLMHSFVSMLPMIILTGLLLAILPMESTKPDIDNNLAVAKWWTWDEFQMWILCAGSVAMISIVMLFVGLIAVASLFATYCPDGPVWHLFVAIFAGIFAAMLTAFGLSEWIMKPLYAQVGGAATLWIIMGGYTFLTSGLIQWRWKGD